MTIDSVFTGTDTKGRKLLRIEARNAAVPIEKKPPWIRTTMKNRTAVHRNPRSGCQRRPTHCLPGSRLPPISMNAGKTVKQLSLLVVSNALGGVTSVKLIPANLIPLTSTSHDALPSLFKNGPAVRDRHGSST